MKDCLESRLAKQKALEEKPGSETRKDIFHWCYETQDPETGKRYTLSELFAECELMVIAGSDTTANVISAMFFYLARNPDVQAKLAKEISSAFSSYEDIKAGPALVSCKYLTALIQEAIRMAPPVSAEPPREVRQGGTTIDGQYFPAGTKLSTAFWAMHYNPGLYPEPYQFRPERWIVGEGASTKESVALAQRAFCGFSAGTRNCVGKNLAWLEMRIVMAKAIWKFEIKQDENNKLGGGSAEKGPWRSVEDQYQTYEVFVSDRKGPVVQFKKRDH